MPEPEVITLMFAGLAAGMGLTTRRRKVLAGA
ncbi:MAG: PEP-CTERM sorting domain-containing protein [Burkholderiaceae bacterium]